MPSEGTRPPLPAPTINNLFNPFEENPYAPEWLRRAIGGDPSKQIWAGKMTQAVNLAALLFTLGYGSRKMLRGMAPETQAALKAIDEYVPSGVNDGMPSDKRLKDKPIPRKQRKAAALESQGIKTAADLNSVAWTLPPAAAFMAWLVGQKMAENEVHAADLSDSEARLAKARYDYERVLASKIDPNVQLPEKVIKKRMQNPVDWTIDKSIALKNKMLHKEAADWYYGTPGTPTPYKDGVPPREGGMGTYPAQFFTYLEDKIPHFKPLATLLGALTLVGSAKYAWNNNRARDKNIQKALDTEAALKQHALETNDQRLDIEAITGKKDPKLNTYPGALGFDN